jgi:23S rRNA (uracil1939-C5)-methyltransferase
LPEFGLRLAFRPTEFTQVNGGVNRVLVRRAVDLLDPRPHERVGDLFCGLGNFSLPIATRAPVVAMEGSASLVARAQENARANGLESRATFLVHDLYADAPGALARLGPVDKLLIDPPRDGAVDICKALPDAGPPSRIVYVSCSPSTLARDAGVLVHTKGYALSKAGVLSKCVIIIKCQLRHCQLC